MSIGEDMLTGVVQSDIGCAHGVFCVAYHIAAKRIHGLKVKVGRRRPTESKGTMRAFTERDEKGGQWTTQG